MVDTQAYGPVQKCTRPQTTANENGYSRPVRQSKNGQLHQINSHHHKSYFNNVVRETKWGDQPGYRTPMGKSNNSPIPTQPKSCPTVNRRQLPPIATHRSTIMAA